ncbi:MAG: DUF72 domain-containing protein [Thaumarchaeota archaeon]|nr:DUF72 domain-containing protein [Nitrososphaerota archaeon]
MSAKDKVRIGCSGWSYKDWSGAFYPRELAAGEYLKFYSRFFDCVEIDSSFYRIPSPFMIEQWKRNTPDGFLFAPKLPKKITHDNKLENFEGTLAYFYGIVNKLGDKLGPIVAQLPPSIKVEKHEKLMKEFVSALDPKFKHAIEFRHKSWFNPATYKLLEKNNVAMAWSLNQYLETPPEVTAPFAYLRLVGDRDITEFTGIQKDKSEDMKRWAERMEMKSDSFDTGFVFFNNHFAGFGPESANEFRRLLGMMESDWKQPPQAGQGQRQQSLAEF